ncbi:hypothetical protein H2248_008928 [Termitomyces sp. 'cryptogamus']|nr:hypothetical protein H2248_008928 [Termitomyces sp. 'cryptogamus']
MNPVPRKIQPIENSRTVLSVRGLSSANQEIRGSSTGRSDACVTDDIRPTNRSSQTRAATSPWIHVDTRYDVCFIRISDDSVNEPWTIDRAIESESVDEAERGGFYGGRTIPHPLSDF